MKTLISQAAEKTLGLIYPENLYCMACGDTIEATTRVHGLCDKCIGKMDWDSSNPYTEVMDEFAFDRLWTCCRYGFLPRRIMNGLKLSAKTYYVRGLGLMLSERLLHGCQEEDMETEDFYAVTAVPMSPSKLAARGYNQAELLAKEVCGELAMPYRGSLLRKIKETPSLRYSDGRTRRTVLENAFASDEDLTGRSILLVDDVSTTGSTFDACARALKNAGASEVSCLCFATVGTVENNSSVF